MVVKQTDRSQIERFGREGIAIFDQIEANLRGLVTEMAEVAYRGQNALEAKTRWTQSAVDFAEQCTLAMQQMAEVVSTNTTYIATNLGGQPIDLEAPAVVIELPKIDADTSVESADSGPLVTLRGSITSICGQVDDGFNENLSNLVLLGSDGWVGPEYDDTLDQVTRVTQSISQTIEESKTVMVSDITNQLQALGME